MKHIVLLLAITLVAAAVPVTHLPAGSAQAPEPARQIDYSRAVALETTADTSANASLGDLDGDGDLDIVLAKGRHWPLVDFVLLNDGTGGFAQRHEVGGSADRTYTAALADLDGDGDLDLVAGNDRPDAVLANDDSGRSFEIISFGDTGDGAAVYGLAIGDVDGDGIPDIVAGRSDAPNMLYFGCCRRP